MELGRDALSRLAGGAVSISGNAFAEVRGLEDFLIVMQTRRPEQAQRSSGKSGGTVSCRNCAALVPAYALPRAPLDKLRPKS